MSEEEIEELIRKIEEDSPEEGELRCWMHDWVHPYLFKKEE